MDESKKLTREITLTLGQWRKIVDAMEFYLNTSREFLSRQEAGELLAKDFLFAWKQMPQKLFQ